MGFLFPLFLVAALSLIVPLLIHLFNLRKYKRIHFPDTRFLRNIQLSTRRQAKVQHFWLMVTRMLFLLVLVLAFAQPYFPSANSKNTAVTAVYIDNSYSMSGGSGQQSLLQQAKNRARALLEGADVTGKFLILSNDKPSATRPMLRDEALKALAEIEPSARKAGLKRIMQSVAAAQDNERNEKWNIYLFSDLQAEAFVSDEKMVKPANAQVYVYPMQEQSLGNLFIDTAYFLSPQLDARQANELVVVARKSGDVAGEEANLKVLVGEQVRAVSTLVFDNDTMAVDTLPLQLIGNGWQKIAVTLQDHPFNFDDTFRVATRTLPALSILVVSDEPLNPYLQAAFRTNEGFTIEQQRAGSVAKDQWSKYSLVVLQNLRSIDLPLQNAVKEALGRGQSVLIFPGLMSNTAAFNSGLKSWADITLSPADTARQQVVTLQQAHPLLQDLFEKVPENVQLPVTTRRYPIEAGMAANQQALLSFRDGKPFLAQYTSGQGKIFICAAPLDDRSSNFALSYFFVPVLYKMALQSGGSNVYATAVGSTQSLWLPAPASDSRKVFHLFAPGFDAIPPQRPSGSGVELFAGNTVQQAGFYQLHSETTTDTTLVAFNADRVESFLVYADKDEVDQLLEPLPVTWLDAGSVAKDGWRQAEHPWPLWKIAVILGLVLLVIETWLMLRKPAVAAISQKA